MVLSRFQLNPKDLAEIDEIYGTIARTGMYSYATLMTATDDQGQAWSYLANEENFQFFSDSSILERNLFFCSFLET